MKSFASLTQVEPTDWLGARVPGVAIAIEVPGLPHGRMAAPRDDWQLENGFFEPEAMIQILGKRVEESIARGFTGMRGSGEMTWALGTEQGCERFIEFEALLNDFFPGKPFVAICQYNMQRFDASTTIDVLRTHHHAVVGDHVCPNLYFEPKSMVLGQPTDEERLAWRVSQLKRAREQLLLLERALQSRDTFLNVASHELGTPLTTLNLRLAQVQAMLGEHALSERLVAHVESAQEQVQRLKELCGRLTDVSELNQRALALLPTPVDLFEIVKSVVEWRSPAAKKAGCAVSVEGTSVSGVWDGPRLEQLVDALVSNALKYGAGGPVSVKLAMESGVATLIVQDEGIGIPPEDRNRIFAPFERAVAEEHYSGFGLGLWMARQIAEAHGGSISVDSVPGQGSVFVVKLPQRMEFSL
jgi:signal transduction histidine kinase